ncbi:TetR family transcriptional regulator [Kineosporia rhizophila]|uniref:TetR/AcrR family transcriptional regulator n=1 Tax=Kineosporia TaxID=49184 RepID=UPI001E53764C|nr:TetR family transcriptional regulator [Kineosporia sp. NBRC 101677]MCE0540720.1 TetR family transcriptional regulator [Kineosporia rhizophila]GLY18381.1 putative transcriptional regulator, TetR family [Kineosporia sp. NBRC 101677]
MAGKRSAASKERLSREAIVTSALALADREGLDAVTIRRLATDHGVTPMALYWHFKDKDVLLDGVIEQVLEEVVLPSYPAGDTPAWDVRLHDCFAAILEALSRHPEVADLVHKRFLGSSAGLNIGEFAFSALRDGGFSRTEMATIGVQALHNLVVLVTMEPGERALRDSEEEIALRTRQKKAVLQTLAPERYPNIIICAEDLVDRPVDEAGYRDLGLDILIEGIRARAAKLARP